MKYRVITDGHRFKVQERSLLWPFWSTVQRPEDLDNKDFGGDKCFDTKEKADAYIKEKTPRVWKEVK